MPPCLFLRKWDRETTKTRSRRGDGDAPSAEDLGDSAYIRSAQEHGGRRHRRVRKSGVAGGETDGGAARRNSSRTNSPQSHETSMIDQLPHTPPTANNSPARLPPSSPPLHPAPPSRYCLLLKQPQAKRHSAQPTSQSRPSPCQSNSSPPGTDRLLPQTTLPHFHRFFLSSSSCVPLVLPSASSSPPLQRRSPRRRPTPVHSRPAPWSRWRCPRSSSSKHGKQRTPALPLLSLPPPPLLLLPPRLPPPLATAPPPLPAAAAAAPRAK